MLRGLKALRPTQGESPEVIGAYNRLTDPLLDGFGSSLGTPGQGPLSHHPGRAGLLGASPLPSPGGASPEALPFFGECPTPPTDRPGGREGYWLRSWSLSGSDFPSLILAGLSTPIGWPTHSSLGGTPPLLPRVGGLHHPTLLPYPGASLRWLHRGC